MHAIEVHHLHKHYGSLSAVDGVSFHVEPGEVYGLLGHNGAGKTTIIEILEGHRQATSGEVSVLGFEPHRNERGFRDRIGVVLQSTAVDRYLTVRETLDTYGRAYSRRRDPDEVLELVGLTEKANDQVRSLSGGQSRRLDLGVGIIGDPEVLFLDEPTTGFDPLARRQSWDLIDQLCRGGAAVILTTHYLDEVERLANRVGVLSKGVLVAEGSPSELISTSPTVISVRLPEAADPTALPFLADAGLDASVRPGADSDPGGGSGVLVEFSSAQPTADLAELTTAAVQHGIEFTDISVRRASLEDIYVQIETGSPNGDQR